MTKAQLKNRTAHGKKDAISKLCEHKSGAGRLDAPVKLGLFQSIVVAGYHTLAARTTRRVLRGLETDRLRDIGLEPSGIDRAATDTAARASKAFAWRLGKFQHSAGHRAGFLNAERECSLQAARGQR